MQAQAQEGSIAWARLVSLRRLPSHRRAERRTYPAHPKELSATRWKASWRNAST